MIKNVKRRKKYLKDYAIKHKTELREYQQKYFRENAPAYSLSRIKRRAIAKGIPFSIKLADIVWPKKCPILGLLLDYSVGTKNGKPLPNSPSIDRIIPSIGYILGNVQIISHRANVIKQDATSAELQRVADYMRVFE